MKLVGHIMAADVRRYWPALAAWLLLVAVTAAQDGVHPRLVAEGGSALALGVFAELSRLAKLLAAFLVVPLIVQTHTLVGTEAYWMTRPIPPRALLAAKALLIGLVMIAAPLLAEAALMVAYGVPFRTLAGVTAESALWQSFRVGLLFSAAVLTRNLTGFALLIGSALVAGIALVGTMLAFALMGSDEVSPGIPRPVGPDDPTGLVMWTLLVIAAAAALVVSQYRTRWRVRSVLIGASALAVAFVLPALWPWPFLMDGVELPSWARASAALHLRADRSSVRLSDERGMGGRKGWQTLTAALRVEGVQPGWSANAGLLESTIARDGERLASDVILHPQPIPTEWDDVRPGEGVAAALLGVERIITPGPAAEQVRVPLFFARTSEVPGPAPFIGTYRGRFQIQLVRHEVEAALRLRSGARHAADSYRLRVASVERTRMRVVVTALESSASSVFDRRPSADTTFYLRSVDAREAVLGYASEDMQISPLLAMLMPFGMGRDGSPTGFAASGDAIEFAVPEGADPSFAFTDGWIDGADLVVVQATREGSVERTLEVTDVPLVWQPPADAAAPGSAARSGEL